MNLISTSQMRKIYALARERGMDNDLLHVYITNITKKESIKTLTIMEAVKVIDALEEKSTSGKELSMSKKQFAYINMLLKDLGWMTEDGECDYKRLNGFIKKRYALEHYKWLTVSEASRVIEGLKNMVKNMEDK